MADVSLPDVQGGEARAWLRSGACGAREVEDPQRVGKEEATMTMNETTKKKKRTRSKDELSKLAALLVVGSWWRPIRNRPESSLPAQRERRVILIEEDPIVGGPRVRWHDGGKPCSQRYILHNYEPCRPPEEVSEIEAAAQGGMAEVMSEKIALRVMEMLAPMIDDAVVKAVRRAWGEL
jgi:hypothetical protein